MPIRRGRLEDSGVGFDSNQMKGAMQYHAGRDYYTACLILQREMKNGAHWLYHVEIPLMAQCIELFVKAFIRYVDLNPNPRGHRILRLMSNYQAQIPVFARILADAEKVDLIEQLERAYLELRYAEVAISYETSDMDLFNSIADELIDEFRSLSGLPF